MEWLDGQPQSILGPPVVPSGASLGGGFPAKKDYRKKSTFIVTSLLEDLAYVAPEKKAAWLIDPIWVQFQASHFAG